MRNPRTSWQKALWLALSLRVIYTLLAAGIALVQPVNWSLVHSNALTENLAAPNRSLRYLLLSVWERFDTLWYLHIAAGGYDLPASIVFFPLYPLLIRVCSYILQPIAAALLVSTVAFFFLLWGLYELLLPELNAQFAEKSVLLFAVWPASFIFLAGYAESLLLALIVWSFVMAYSEHWKRAAVLGMAAALTKAVGVVVVVPLLAIALRRKQAAAWPVLAVPLGSAAFIGWLHWTGHGSIASAYGQYWRTFAAMPWNTLWMGIAVLFRTPNALLALNFIFLIVVCVLIAMSKLRTEYLLYAAAAIIVCLTKQTDPPLQSTLRYMLILFPAPVGLARCLQSPRLQPRFAIICAALFAANLGLLWLYLGWSLVL